MMKNRTLTLIATAAILTLVGCNGPTATGIQARKDARGRLDLATARFTYDQALNDYEAGQLERAEAGAKRAIGQTADVPEFHILHGRTLLEQNKLEEAVAVFEETLQVDENWAEAYYYLGIIYQRWSDDELAFENYHEAHEIDPSNVQFLLATSESLIALGELDAAQELVESKLTFFEHNASLRHMLAQIAMLKGDDKEAARLYSEARMLQPENKSLVEEMAWVQYEAGLYGECLETIDTLRTETVEPRNDLMHLEARCMAMLGRDKDAHKAYMELSRLDAGNPAIWIEFGTLAWKLGDYRRLAQCGSRTVALAPDRYEGYMLQGLYERKHGNIEDAVEALGRSVELAPKMVVPYLMLGEALEEAGNPRAAYNVYTAALELDPANQNARARHDELKKTLKIASAE